MGDFSDPREFTEREVREILYDDYFLDGIAPFKALESIYNDIASNRLDYKIQAWGFSKHEILRIVREIGVEQLNLLVSRS